MQLYNLAQNFLGPLGIEWSPSRTLPPLPFGSALSGVFHMPQATMAGHMAMWDLFT